MTILVTGGSGFVGLNVLQQLLERGERVVDLSLAPPPPAAQRYLSALPGTLHALTGDVRDAASVEAAFAAHRPERVLHAAVITADAERERREPGSIIAVNTLGTLNVLEAARRHGVERLVYPSSGSVYGDSAFAHDVLEEDITLPQPVTLYGITKYAGERMALRWRTLHGMDVVAARLGIVFGRWEYATGHRDTLSPIYHLTRMARAGQEALLPTPGLRDWIYAPDVAAALIALLDAARTGFPLYHVAAGRQWSAEAWCERLQARYPDFRYRVTGEEGDAAAQANINLHRATMRAPLSNRRLLDDLGVAARYDLDASLADYLDWLDRCPLD